jgi:hypothetical protein
MFDASSWLFYTKLVTMHDHLNIKYIKRLKDSLTQHSTKAIKLSERQNLIELKVFCASGKKVT